MTYGGSEFIKMTQKNNKITCIFFLLVLGGGQDIPAWTACTLGVKITRVGAGYPGGATCPGVKINWDTDIGTADSANEKKNTISVTFVSNMFVVAFLFDLWPDHVALMHSSASKKSESLVISFSGLCLYLCSLRRFIV